MMRSGTPLGQYVKDKIFYGIKTGFNEAFVIDGETRKRLIREDSRSAEVIKALAFGKHVRKWYVEKPDLWLIATAVGIDIKRYPAIFKHLKQWQRELERRWDKGDHWWELRPCDYYDELARPKIVFPDIAKEMRFALDSTATYVGNTVYFIPVNDLYLLGVLNSSVVQDYYLEISSQFRGGYIRGFTQYIEKIPIPKVPDDKRLSIEALVRRCMASKGQNCESEEQELDSTIAKLYGLAV